MLSDTLRELQSLTKQAWKGMLGTRIGSVVEELNKAIEELKEKDARHVYSEQLMAELRAGIGLDVALCVNSLWTMIYLSIRRRTQTS